MAYLNNSFLICIIFSSFNCHSLKMMKFLHQIYNTVGYEIIPAVETVMYRWSIDFSSISTFHIYLLITDLNKSLIIRVVYNTHSFL